MREQREMPAAGTLVPSLLARGPGTGGLGSARCFCWVCWVCAMSELPAWAPGTPRPQHRLSRLLFPANADAGAELGRKLAIRR